MNIRFDKKQIHLIIIGALFLSNFFFMFRSIKIESNYKAYMAAEINRIIFDLDSMENIVNNHLVDLDFTKGSGKNHMDAVVTLSTQLKDNYKGYASYYFNDYARKNSGDKTAQTFVFISDVLYEYSILASNYCNESNYTNDKTLNSLINELSEFIAILKVRDFTEAQDSTSKVIKTFNIRNGDNEDLRKFIETSNLIPTHIKTSKLQIIK
ncbi:hypothetical protein [Clostridium sp.]|uniref:hypothetical protein n=1 Tax=Clostridium sp. TaxID=1506 RepID=UPI002FC89250